MKNTNLLLVVTLVLLILPHIVKAQFFAEINTGYAAPLYYLGYSKINETNFPNSYRYYDNSANIDTSYITYSKYNMGNDMLFGAILGYKIKNNWLISINCNYLNNYKYNIFYKPFTTETLRQSNSFYENEEYSLYTYHKQKFYYGKRFSLTPSISYRILNNKFGFESSLGLSLSYLTVYRNIEITEETINGYTDFESSNLKSSVYKEYYNKNNHFGILFSLAFLYQISNNLELHINTQLNALSGFFVDSGTRYYQSNYLQIDGVVIENIENLNELDIPSTRPEYYNFNTLNFSLGIRYYFNKKDPADKNE